MKNNSICPHCQEGYVMGWNGTENGCDVCLGVVRDSKGYAWYPDDEFHDYQDINTGEIFCVSRADALRPKPKVKLDESVS